MYTWDSVGQYITSKLCFEKSGTTSGSFYSNNKSVYFSSGVGTHSLSLALPGDRAMYIAKSGGQMAFGIVGLGSDFELTTNKSGDIDGRFWLFNKLMAVTYSGVLGKGGAFGLSLGVINSQLTKKGVSVDIGKLMKVNLDWNDGAFGVSIPTGFGNAVTFTRSVNGAMSIGGKIPFLKAGGNHLISLAYEKNKLVLNATYSGKVWRRFDVQLNGGIVWFPGQKWGATLQGKISF